MQLRLCHLYPDELNMYGDRGNIICIKKRLKWRGIDCTVEEVGIGDEAVFSDFDLFFIGGGQNFEQELICADLKTKKGSEIVSAIEDGKTFLCICAGYQMMGHYYETYNGDRYGFLGAIDFHTVASAARMIGDYAFRLGEKSGASTVVGFENHSGKTYLEKNVSPLGKVIKGHGNNGTDFTEGVRYKNVFGTYSHGPVLPGNPEFCDHILQTALERKYGKVQLSVLEDSYENLVHRKRLIY
nr:glutamine amidotransferase [Lachnospiraceae bacterium C1.1]